MRKCTVHAFDSCVDCIVCYYTPQTYAYAGCVYDVSRNLNFSRVIVFKLQGEILLDLKEAHVFHMQLMGEDGSKVVALNKKVRHEKSLKGRMRNIERGY